MLSIVVVDRWILWTRQIYQRYVTGSSGYDSHNYMIAPPPEKMLRARSTTTYTANRGNVHSQRASARSPRPASTEHAHRSRKEHKRIAQCSRKTKRRQKIHCPTKYFPKNDRREDQSSLPPMCSTKKETSNSVPENEGRACPTS